MQRWRGCQNGEEKMTQKGKEAKTKNGEVAKTKNDDKWQSLHNREDAKTAKTSI